MSRLPLALVTLFFSVTSSNPANAGQSPLLELAQGIHCAQTGQEVSALLSKLSSLSAQPFGIPSDNLRGDEKSLLYAATVDILLQVLYETVQRYPDLQEAAERAVLQWNYCQMLADGEFADLSVSNSGEILQQQAVGPFPINKQGFAVWGFLNPDPKNRYTPKIIQDAAIWPRFHEDLVFRLNQQQCFPHPDTGALFGEKQTDGTPQYGELKIKEMLELGGPYPYLWVPDCGKMPVYPDPQAKSGQKTIEKNIDAKAVKKSSGGYPKLKQEQTVEENLAQSFPAFVPEVKPAIKAAKPIKTEPVAQANKPAATATKAPTNKAKKGSVLGLDEYSAPDNNDVPVVSPSIASANANAAAALPLPSSSGFGISGSFYHRAKLTGAMSVGGNLGWRPFSNFFVRTGANYTYLPDSGLLTYSWGIGYDDWHPGTVSVQLNNWGPIKPGEGLALDKAVTNIGYKFKADFLRPYHIGGSAAVNIPLNGDPSIATTWSWNPIGYWFIRASVQRNFGRKEGWNWSYGFGYADYHPFTLSLTYDNWGVNPIFDSKQGDAFNFQENGAVSLSWSWAF